MATLRVLCRLGMHSWTRSEPSGRTQGPVQEVCRSCGQQREVIALPPGGGGV